MIKRFIQKIVKQYITCKHEKYTVVRKIMCPSKTPKPKWMERRKCEICGREYYSDYFFEYGKERHYVKYDD